MQSTSDMISMTSGANCGVVGGMKNLGWVPCPPRAGIPVLSAPPEVLAGNDALGQQEQPAPGDEAPTVQPAHSPTPALAYSLAYSIDRTDESARITALIQHHELDTALRDLRTLPSSLPQLPALLGQLILALAQVGRHEDTTALASEMLARFPLRPEVTRTLIALAAILTVQGRFRQVFRRLGDTVLHTYAFSRTALGEWAQRLAYQFRRHGNPEAARCILGTWGNATAI